MMRVTVHGTLWVLALGGALAGTGAAAQLAGFRVNVTPSVPLGLWRIHSAASIARGDVVTVCPPDTETTRTARERGYFMHGSCPGSFMPLIKPVAAIAGDSVSIDGGGVHVNGALIPNSKPLTRDERGRLLTTPFEGLRRVQAGEVFVVSSYNALSYDSRYFGMVPTAGVRGVAAPTWISQWKPFGE